MDIYKIEGSDLRVLLDKLGTARSEPQPTCVRVAIDDGVKVKVDEDMWTYPLGEREGGELKRYIIEYRDASGFDWQRLTDETFDEPGDALSRRDQLIEREEAWLPRNRHRAVDRETGAILEWVVTGVQAK